MFLLRFYICFLKLVASCSASSYFLIIYYFSCIIFVIWFVYFSIISFKLVELDSLDTDFYLLSFASLFYLYFFSVSSWLFWFSMILWYYFKVFSSYRFWFLKTEMLYLSFLDSSTWAVLFCSMAYLSLFRRSYFLPHLAIDSL